MKARTLIAGLLAPLALAGAAHAEDAGLENQLRTQLRTTVTQMRELQDQQATLQAQKAAAEQERDALKKKVGGAGAGPSRKALAEAAALKRSLAGSRAEAETARQAAAQAQSELAMVKQQLDQAQSALHALQAEGEETKATLAATASTLEACKIKNVELISVGNEVLDRYKKVGVSGAVIAREPFTGLHRIKLQNLAQGYEDRLYAGRYDPRRDKAPPQARPAPAVTEPSSH